MINFGLLDTSAPEKLGSIPGNALAKYIQNQQQMEDRAIARNQAGVQNALAQMQLTRGKREMDEEDAYRTALGNVQGGDYAGAMPDLMRASPTRALALKKSLVEDQRAGVDAALKRFELIDRTAGQFAANPTRQTGVWVLSQLAANGTPPEVIKTMSDKLNAARDEELPQMAQAFLSATQEGMKAKIQEMYPKPAPTPPPSDIGRLMAERDALPPGDPRRATYDDAIKKANHIPAPGGGLLSGPENQDDVFAIADAIEEGTQPPDWKALYKYGAPLRAELSRRKVNVARLQTDWNAIQKNVAALNSTQQTRLRQAINKASESLSNIEGLYDEWTQLAGSNFSVFNKGALAASKQMPGRAGEVARALEMNIADLTAELGAAYMGGNTPTEHALELAGKNLAADWGPGQFREAVKQARKNLAFATNAITSSTPLGVGEDSPYRRPGGPADRGTASEGGSPTAPSGMNTMPPPAAHKGRVIKDSTTGIRYQSDGQSWVRIQ